MYFYPCSGSALPRINLRAALVTSPFSTGTEETLAVWAGRPSAWACEPLVVGPRAGRLEFVCRCPGRCCGSGALPGAQREPRQREAVSAHWAATQAGPLGGVHVTGRIPPRAGNEPRLGRGRHRVDVPDRYIPARGAGTGRIWFAMRGSAAVQTAYSDASADPSLAPAQRGTAFAQAHPAPSWLGVQVVVIVAATTFHFRATRQGAHCQRAQSHNRHPRTRQDPSSCRPPLDRRSNPSSTASTGLQCALTWRFSYFSR